MENKKRNILIVIVVFLAIGFAAVSTTLVINGIVGLGFNKDDFVVIFTNAILDGKEEKRFISDDKKTINYDTNTLTLLNDKSSLEYEVTNTSKNYDAKVVIECNIEDDENINVNDYVDMTFTPEEMIVKSGMKKSGLIDVTMKKVVVEDIQIGLKCTLVATPIEKDTLADEPTVVNRGTLMVAPKNFYGYGSSGNKEEDKFWAVRRSIAKVVFENTMNPHEVFLNPEYSYNPATQEYTSDTEDDYIFDVSEAQDGSVMAYLVRNDPTDYHFSDFTVYIQSSGGVIANTDSSYLFYMFSNLSSIEDLEHLDTSNVTNMSHMFDQDQPNYVTGALVELNVSSFDTSNVIDMSYMFSGCINLTTLDLSNFDFSSVTSLANMFLEANGIIEIKGILDIPNVTSTADMFGYSSSLKEVRIKNLKANLLVNTAPLLSSESINYMLMNVQNITETKTITLGSNMSKATQEAIQNATSKGFTVV